MQAACRLAVVGSVSIILAACGQEGAEMSEQRRSQPLAEELYALTIASPQSNVSVSGTIDVSGAAAGFINVEVHSADGQLLARTSPTADGTFSAQVDTTRLTSGFQTIAIDAWDSPAGTQYTQHASTSLTFEVASSVVSTPPIATPSSSCIDSNGHGIRYFGTYSKNTQTNYDFEKWSGFRQDFLTSFINCDTWANAAASDWGFDIMKLQPPGENIQQVVCLSTSEDPSLRNVGSGMYDAQIQQVANLFLKHNYPNAIIRLGHEFEGFWYPWGLATEANAGDHEGFISAFRRVATILKATSPTFTIVWNPGCSYWAEAGRDELAYPGDDVVDVIGIDCYNDNSGVDHLINGAYGMNWWAAFAKAHGKPIALPEWGLMQSGGDEPAYIQAMFDFMVNNDTYLEAFWNSADGDTMSELSLGQAPQSGAKFLETFARYAKSCGR